MANIPQSPVTAADVHDRCVGLAVWFRAARESAEEYDDVKINRRIPKLIRRFEREAQYRINQVQLVTYPDGTYDGGTLTDPVSATTVPANKAGTMPLIVENPYTYFAADSYEYLRQTMRERPVQQIQRLRFMWNANDLIYSVPQSWIHFDSKAGRMWLLPVSGQAIVGNAAVAFQALNLAFGFKSYVPNIICFDYIAGLPAGWQNGNEWADLLDALTSYVSVYILDDICEMFDSGLLSKTINSEGANWNIQYERFVRKRKELMSNAASYMETLKAQETPFMLGGV